MKGYVVIYDGDVARDPSDRIRVFENEEVAAEVYESEAGPVSFDVVSLELIRVIAWELNLLKPEGRPR